MIVTALFAFLHCLTFRHLILLWSRYPKAIPTKNTVSKKQPWDFPGGPVVKNLPSNAGDVGYIPGRGTKISQAAGQLSLHTATTEHVSHN